MPKVAGTSACLAVSLYRLHIQASYGHRRKSPVPVCQSLSFKPFAAVNATFFDAAMVMASPVAGLRP